MSSTGHLILVERFIELSADKDFNNSFMILIQFPAILSVVIYFWKDVWPFHKDSDERAQRIVLWKKLIIALLPAIVAGLLMADTIDRYFFAPFPVAVALIVGGIVLIVMERVLKNTPIDTLESIPLKVALGIGLFQCLALFPGTSRSGATIFGAMVLGLDRKTAAQFSFILAIPTMGAAMVYELATSGLSFTGSQWGLIAAGSVVSFLTAYVAVYLFMGYIQKRSFALFGWYRIALGVTIIATLLTGVMD